MQSLAALVRAAANPLNFDVLLELVRLEIKSTYSFQQGRWLGDIAEMLGLLDAPTLAALKEAKERAAERERLEETIPADLLYCEGWLTRLPTPPEARLYAAVRRRVGQLVDLEVEYTEEETVTERFAELLEEKEVRLGRRRQKAAGTKKFARRKKRERTPFGTAAPQLPLPALQQVNP